MTRSLILLCRVKVFVFASADNGLHIHALCQPVYHHWHNSMFRPWCQTKRCRRQMFYSIVIVRNVLCLYRECCEFLNQLLHTWPTHMLERHIAVLQETIKKALSDADSEARAHARKWVDAFWYLRTYLERRQKRQEKIKMPWKAGRHTESHQEYLVCEFLLPSVKP